MSTSTGKNNNAGCLILIAIGIFASLIFSIVRYFSDKPIYKEAHTAYLQADCDSADPMYNEIINKFRLFDFGKIKANSKEELRYCEEFVFAVNGGINSLYDLAIEHPENPLVEFVDEKTAEMLESIGESAEYAEVLNNDVCTKEAELVDTGLLLEGSTLPLFKLECSKYLVEAGIYDESFDHLAGVLENYPQHPIAAQIRDSLKSETTFCPLTQQMSGSPIFTSNMDNLASIYLDCGSNYVGQDEFKLAANIYESFLVEFPDHPSVETINQLLPELLVKAARASGSGTIERPNEVGWAPAGIARVVIQNDSPHELRIVFSGPGARIEILPACESCTDYSGLGPIYCPEMGPIGTYDLIPGEFEVLVETTNESDIIPFTGTWAFQDGKEFYTCFFIVTSFY